MIIKIDGTSYSLFMKDGVIFKINASGRGKPVAVDKKEIANYLSDQGTPYSEMDMALTQFISKLPKKDENLDDLDAMVDEEIEKEKIIESFRYVTIGESSFTYLFSSDKLVQLQIGYPSTTDWVQYLITHKNQELCRLQEKIAHLINPKKPKSVELEAVATRVATGMKFSLRDDLKVTLESEIKPVTLSSSNELSLYKVDYETISQPKLNPFMEEFLSRVENHEHLCAITWILFNGHKSPYVVYLYGTGGEGKSSFLNVLAKKIKNFASFQSSNQFSNYHMHNKALILLTENTDCYLLQSQAIKQLTGNSQVACEQKNKTSFTSTLTGTMFVDANKMLKLKGEDAEKRRLRLFKVSKPNYKTQLDMKSYEAKLSDNFIDFLNYCRQCFEKVGSPNSWLVPPSPSQENDFKSLTDQAFISNSESILRKIFKDLNLKFDSDGVVSSKIFWDSFYKLQESKDKYLGDNLKDYLYLHRQVTMSGDSIFGLSQSIPTNQTSFVLPDL